MMKLLLRRCGCVCVNLPVVMRRRPSCVNVVVPMPRDGGGHYDVTMKLRRRWRRHRCGNLAVVMPRRRSCVKAGAPMPRGMVVGTTMRQ